MSIPKDSYLGGYQSGLKQYCTYKSGFDHGLRGKEMFKECAAASPLFARGYHKGFEEFERQEEDKRLKEKKENERAEVLSNAIRRYGSKECTSNFQCVKDGTCRFNKCEHNGAACSSDYDCRIEGRCKSESEYVSSVGEWIQVRVCEY